MSRRQKRTSILFLFGLPVLVLFFWLGNHDSHCAGSIPIRSYGGKISEQASRVLAYMAADIQNARAILTADASHIVIIDGQNKKKEYTFAYGALWLNEKPVIQNVQSFHFEYRDLKRNYLTRIKNQLNRLNTVGFVIRLQRHNRPVLANASFEWIQYTESGQTPSRFASLN